MLYSVRFILTGTPNAYVAYAVPVGKRAVITTITCCNTITVTAGVSVSINSLQIFYFSIPAQAAQVYGAYRTVVYGGESIRVLISQGGCPVSVSGWLFDDAGRAVAPPTTTTPIDYAGVLPAGDLERVE